MKEFNGKHLMEFKNISKLAPEFFYKKLDNLADHNLILVLKFTHALNLLSDDLTTQNT